MGKKRKGIVFQSGGDFANNVSTCQDTVNTLISNDSTLSSIQDANNALGLSIKYPLYPDPIKTSCAIFAYTSGGTIVYR